MEHVAIVSEDPYPDPRVEREINTLLKKGYRVTLLAALRGRNPCTVFGRARENLDCINYVIPRVARVAPHLFWHLPAKRLRRLLRNVKPDVVLAINPAAGYIVEKAGDYPLVLDDHEYFYMEVRYETLFGPSWWPLYKRMGYAAYKTLNYATYVVFRLEARLAERHPIIMVSRQAAEDFAERFGATRVYVLKNYSSIEELPRLELSSEGEPAFVYVGRDLPPLVPYRDPSLSIRVVCEAIRASRSAARVVIAGVDGAYECARGLGWLDSRRLYRVLQESDYGLLTWAPHPFHRYASPNKAYNYALAGVIPVVTSSLESVVEDLGHLSVVIDAASFEESLREKIAELLSMSVEERMAWREKLARYARVHLVWEKQEHVLLDALRNAS